MKKPNYFVLASGKPHCHIPALILLVLVGRAFSASGQTVTNLYSFAGFPSDGNLPYAGLVQGSDGNFYGTTINGGTNSSCAGGCGTVFRISPSGNYTNLYRFGSSPNDGHEPVAPLVQGYSDGNLYGTTSQGGTTNFGTVFRISPNGSYTNLHSFSGSPDGASPQAGLVQGSDGNFYGTTSFGGSTNRHQGAGVIGNGMVFRITPSGSETNLYSFGNFPDGASPAAGLVQGSDGSFYGTTSMGGANSVGTVFRITPSGSETNLHSFSGSPDGANPLAGLVQGSDGSFYGTTSGGGANGGGIVFRISPSGAYTNLHSFGNFPDGVGPNAGLVEGSDGTFYGTTVSGGANSVGTVFRISPSGSETNLHSFGNFPDGANPNAGLVQGGDGSFYGTTKFGGANTNCFSGCGTVFKFSVPLNPPAYPINQITGIQLSGTNIVFNIPSIAYETYQLQFSSSMTPTNWVNVPGVSVTNSIGALLTVTNFGGALQSQGFYRFDITP